MLCTSWTKFNGETRSPTSAHLLPHPHLIVWIPPMKQQLLKAAKYPESDDVNSNQPLIFRLSDKQKAVVVVFFKFDNLVSDSPYTNTLLIKI